MDYVLRATLDKRLGTFEDRWDPEALLRGCGFDCLFDGATMAESVLAFEQHPNGDAVLRIAFTDAEEGAGAREERLVHVPQGNVKRVMLLDLVEE